MTRERNPRRRKTDLGTRGEEAAARFLAERGFAVVARNLDNVHGEIDLLLRRGRLYVAVEVKTRTHHPAPERLVQRAQLHRLERALLALAPGLRPRPRFLRIDVVAVTMLNNHPELRHFVARGPFRPRAFPHT